MEQIHQGQFKKIVNELSSREHIFKCTNPMSQCNGLEVSISRPECWFCYQLFNLAN